MFGTPTNPMKPESAVDKLLENMSGSGFQGRKLGEGFQIWKEMIETPGIRIILGLSGALVPAGMQECIIQLAENRFIDCIVSTGANMFHDLCEHTGIRHYKGTHLADDAALFADGVNRIYDVFASDKEICSMEEWVCDLALSLGKQTMSSRAFLQLIGEKLNAEYPNGRSILGTCAKAGIPIHVPALADSSIGIGLVEARRRGAELLIDQVADADELSEFVELGGKSGVIYLGGGTPKNFIQQTEVIRPKYQKKYLGGHQFALQFTTDAPHWGGLSGCTFEEGISWGKEKPESRKLQCFCDITIALPIVTSALLASGVRRA